MTSLIKGVVIVGAKRTPFGTYGGKFVKTSPTDLQVVATKAALAAANVKPELIDTVNIGNVLTNSAVDGIFIPRHVSLKVGIPLDRPALMVNRLCGSGFQAIVNGVQDILTGMAQISLTGGVDNMSLAPHTARGVRFGVPLGQNITLEDSLWLGLTDTYCKLPMALTAEKLGAQYNITRDEVDNFSYRSQQLWKAAQDGGRFKEEIAPVPVKVKKETVNLDVDEHPRPQTTLEGLKKLPTLFKENGLVTAGSASRTVLQLKRCWDKLKRTRKTERAAERRYQMGTGGGPPLDDTKKSLDIDAAVPHLLYEIPNNFDNDGTVRTPSTSESNPSIVEEIPPGTSFDTPTIAHDEQLIKQPDTTKEAEKLLISPKSKSQRIVPRQAYIDQVMAIRIKNAKAEELQAAELHAKRMEIEDENLRAAILKRKAAEVELSLLEIKMQKIQK